MAHPARIKRALIVCDMQADALPSLFSKPPLPDDTSPRVDPAARREAFVEAVRSAVIASVSSPLPEDNALVIFLGLRFPSGYEGLHPEHGLYGSLRRLNEKVGDKHCHWFMEGHPGSEIDGTLLDLVVSSSPTRHAIVWRRGHLPPDELTDILRDNSITDATVVGAKASQCVQSTVQYVADRFPGIDLSVVREALADDGQERVDAMAQHLLPLYSRVASLEEYVEATCGLEKFTESLSKENGQRRKRRSVHYLSNCQRGGHYSLYAHHLVHRKPSPMKEGTCWVAYPTQKWYEDVFRGKQYYCPLGKRVVSFCDEPSFSGTAMFIKGRECLDDKAKLVKLAKSAGPWFVKETNKNGGRAIQMCNDASECIALSNNPQETYVIQRHITNPHLTRDLRKWHLKLYNLLVCERHLGDAFSWTLRCHEEAFLCVASAEWSTDNLTPEAQITIERTRRFKIGRSMEELGGDADAYASMFERCSETVASIVERAIDSKELQGRPEKAQFELFSADFMFDATLEKVYLIEFNFSPVIFDPHANQSLTTPGLRKYNALFQRHGEKAEVNDHDMIKDAVSLVFYPKEAEPSGNVGGWRVVQTFAG